MEGKWIFTKQYRRTSRVKANYFCVDCKDKFVDAQLFLDANDGKLREQIPLWLLVRDTHQTNVAKMEIYGNASDQHICKECWSVKSKQDGICSSKHRWYTKLSSFIATADCNWQPGSRRVEQSCRKIRLCSWWMHSLEGELRILEFFRGWSHRHFVSAKEQAIIGVWYLVITYSKTCYLTSLIWGVTILMTSLAPPSQYTLGLFTMYDTE